MLPQKTVIQGLVLWLVILISTLVTQLWMYQPETEPEIGESQINLVKNASLPIFLSENRAAAIRQLESLIQDTNIREIRIYGADQTQIASVLNTNAPQGNSPVLVDNFPVTFQGSLAGSVQLELNGQNDPGIAWSSVLHNSLLVATIVLLLTSVLYFIQRYRKTAGNSYSTQPEILEPSQSPSGEAAGSSLLLFIFPVIDSGLDENKAALDEAITSLYRRLENLVQGYGGRVLSLSKSRFVCRMPSGQSSNDNLQALIFAWGIAKPLVFRFEDEQYRIEIKVLLHKTSVAARQGTLYPAIAEIDDRFQSAIQNSPEASHISQAMKNALDTNIEMEFSPMGGKHSPKFWSISQVKPSLAMLWRKQESSLTSR